MEADFLESLRIDPGDFEPRAAEHETKAREAILAFAERLAALRRRAQHDKEERFFKAAGIAAERVFAGPLLATHPTWMRALLVVDRMLREGKTQGKMPTKAQIKAELVRSGLRITNWPRTWKTLGLSERLRKSAKGKGT